MSLHLEDSKINNILTITKNKIKAINKVLENVLKKEEEDTGMIEKIREISQKHNISNMTLLRRFANPVKDPDPLSATVKAMSYKYPILIKRSEVIEKYQHLTEGKSNNPLIESTNNEHRVLGWIGCKKEMIDHYLNNEDVSPNVKDVIDILYKCERDKVQTYFEVDWEKAEISFGTQMLEREKVQLNTPIVANMEERDVSALVIKILNPEILVNDRVEKIYRANREMFPAIIPQMIGINEQASSLRNSLDPKNRFVPNIRGEYSDKYKVHMTGFFGKGWQVEVPMKKMETDENEEIVNIVDITMPCNSIISCMYDSDDDSGITEMLRALQINGQSVFSLIEGSESTDLNVLYLKAVINAKAKNIIKYHGRNSKIEFNPSNILEDIGHDACNIGFKTRTTEGMCKVSRETIQLSMKWAPYEEILEIFGLFVFLHKNLGKRKIDLNVKNVEKIIKEERLHEMIFSKSKINNSKRNNIRWKEMSGHIITTSINTEESKYEINIDDNMVKPQIIEIIETENIMNECPPIFRKVNGKEIMNISHFIKRSKGISFMHVDAEQSDVVMKLGNTAFLKCISPKERVYIVFKTYLNDNNIVSKIMNEEMPCLSSYFEDLFEPNEIRNLTAYCNLFLKVHIARNDLSSLNKSYLAFVYMWTNYEPVSIANAFTYQYKMKMGMFLDLKFSTHTQNPMNLLWINEEGYFYCFHWEIENSSGFEIVDPKIHVAQGQVEGYRIENRDSDDSYKVHQFTNATRILSGKPDGCSLHCNFMGIVFKIVRDRMFKFGLGKSGARLSTSMKRRRYFDAATMENFEPDFKKKRTL